MQGLQGSRHTTQGSPGVRTQVSSSLPLKALGKHLPVRNLFPGLNGGQPHRRSLPTALPLPGRPSRNVKPAQCPHRLRPLLSTRPSGTSLVGRGSAVPAAKYSDPTPDSKEGQYMRGGSGQRGPQVPPQTSTSHHTTPRCPSHTQDKA